MQTDPNDVRRSWRLHWLGAVGDLTDLERQNSVWLDRAAVPHRGFSAFLEAYYDALTWSAGYEGALASGYVSRSEYAALEPFVRALDGYRTPRGDSRGDAGILADPAWHHVIAAGRRAKAKLLPLIGDPDERARLEGTAS